MKEIKIFSAKWDKYFDDVASDIKQVLKQNNLEGKVNVTVLDIDDNKNTKIFEKYTVEMERLVGIPKNPVRAIPLVVIDGRPFSLGVNPDFKKRLISIA